MTGWFQGTAFMSYKLGMYVDAAGIVISTAFVVRGNCPWPDEAVGAGCCVLLLCAQHLHAGDGASVEEAPAQGQGLIGFAGGTGQRLSRLSLSRVHWFFFLRAQCPRFLQCGLDLLSRCVQASNSDPLCDAAAVQPHCMCLETTTG